LAERADDICPCILIRGFRDKKAEALPYEMPLLDDVFLFNMEFFNLRLTYMRCYPHRCTFYYKNKYKVQSQKENQKG